MNQVNQLQKSKAKNADTVRVYDALVRLQNNHDWKTVVVEHFLKTRLDSAVLKLAKGDDEQVAVIRGMMQLQLFLDSIRDEAELAEAAIREIDNELDQLRAGQGENYE
jgi:hypothetical protein